MLGLRFEDGTDHVGTALEWEVRVQGKPVAVNAEGDLPASAVADIFPAYDDEEGGLLLVLGLFTRPAALFVVIFMLNAIYVTSAKGFFWTAGGAEYSILILLSALYFLIRGGGACSLDRKLGREF